MHYGQRHDKELIAAKRVAEHLGIKEHFVVDVNLVQWGGSALTDQAVEVPTGKPVLRRETLPQATGGGVEPDVIPITYVPGRNTVFLSIALCDSCRIRDQALIEAGCPELATLIGRRFYEPQPATARTILSDRAKKASWRLLIPSCIYISHFRSPSSRAAPPAQNDTSERDLV